MIISKQIWQCVRGGRSRVYGTGAVTDNQATPMLYCAEHGRLCRHQYLKNEDGTWQEFKQGVPNVVDISN